MTEQPSDIAIMLDDAELVSLVSTWPKLSKQQREDIGIISQASGIRKFIVADVVFRAKTHGLIYDNGTVNEFAQKYINTLVAERLQKATKGKPK